MASEAQRGLVRIAANYARLFSSVVLGLLLVRLILRGVGNDGWALVSLVGSTVGIAAMLQDIVRASMIRELGEAHHQGDGSGFRTVYNSALAVTVVVAGLSLIVICSLCLLVPLLQVPDELVGPARWMILAKAAESFVLVLLAAPFNMYLVTERMVRFNLWLILFRAAPLATAVVLFVVLGITDPARGLTLYAVISSGLLIGLQVLAVLIMLQVDRRLVPAPRLVRPQAVRRVLGIGGWNLAVLTSINLHVRADNVLMNLFFGLFGNLIFGLATQLTGYVRMLTMGVTFGLDAVSARLSTADGNESVQRLCSHSTRLHGIVAFPAALGMALLAEPILLIWLGDRIEDPARAVPPTVTLIYLMTVGMVCRAIADGWIKILYGAGHVARYAPLILAGGIANPIIAVVLITILPDDIRYTGAAWSYASVLLIVHLGLLPRRAGRLIGLGFAQIMQPLLRPLIVTLACAPVLVVASRQIGQWSLVELTLVAGGYGVLYAGLTLLFVFDRQEQRRVTRRVRRLLRV